MTDMTAEQALKAANELMARLPILTDDEARDYLVKIRSALKALSAPRVPGAIDADKLHAEKEALDPQAKTPYMHTLRWAQGWNACREAMLAGVPVLTHVTLTNEGDMGQVSDSVEELARLRARVKVLEDVIENVAQSLEYENARGAINDTLWVLPHISTSMTIFDYIDEARLRGGSDE